VLILSCDPGLGGALALVACAPQCRPVLVAAIDVPTVGDAAKRRVWIAPLTEWLLEREKAEVAFIERAQAMPDQGASSGFIYGRAVGALEATILCAGVRLRTAEPSVWKRQMGLLKQDKKASLALARVAIDGAADHLELAKDHNKAEAMLIAVYGARQMGVMVKMPAIELKLTA